MANFVITPDMAKLGFHEMPAAPKPRLIIGTEAHEKCGKTHFMFTAPEPIFYMNFDEGYEGVATKPDFRRKRIIKVDFHVKPGLDKNKYETQFERSKDAFNLACDSKKFRTIVVDVADEWWELARLARLGKLTKVMPEHYGPVNAEFEELINYPKSFDGLNVIYAHKVGKLYKKTKAEDSRGDWDGKSYERKGYKNLAYVVQVNLEHYRYTQADDAGKPVPVFGIRVKNNRMNPDLDGVEFTSDYGACNFASLATEIYPETDLTHWR